MSHATTIPRILKTMGIEPRQVDLIDKVLEMESDKKRVSHVQLHYGTLPGFNLWAEVFMKQFFIDSSEFARYIETNEICHDEFDILHRVEDGKSHDDTYILNSRGVRVEFKRTQKYSGK